MAVYLSRLTCLTVNEAVNHLANLLANQVGFKVGKPRLPLTEPDEKSAALIKDTLKKYKIDLPV